MHSWSRRARALAFPLVVIAGSGCDKPLAEWTEPVPIVQPAGASRFVVDSSGNARFVADRVEPRGVPALPGLCRATFVTAAGSAHLYGAWWNVRADSSAILLVAQSADSGRTWGASMAADTTDIASAGCRRPSPAITTVGDDPYVAYSMIAPEGKGVFFAHVMQGMLHTPVPVIYGDRLVETAIAADPQRVIVAYEEPNGRREQVDLAISVTQGHLFEHHMTASRSVDIAAAPAVAFAGPVIAVSWLTRRPMDPRTTRVVRIARAPKA